MVCGQGAPAYSWYKDGIPLDSSSYIVEEEGRIVVVTNETRDPFGLYTCKTSDVIRQWYLPVQESRGTEVMLWREGGGVGGRREWKAGRNTCFNIPLNTWLLLATLLPTNGVLGGYILMIKIMCISTQKTPLC